MWHMYQEKTLDTFWVKRIMEPNGMEWIGLLIVKHKIHKVATYFSHISFSESIDLEAPSGGWIKYNFTLDIYSFQ